jgi:hypothetical protein
VLAEEVAEETAEVDAQSLRPRSLPSRRRRRTRRRKRRDLGSARGPRSTHPSTGVRLLCTAWGQRRELPPKCSDFVAVGVDKAVVSRGRFRRLRPREGVDRIRTYVPFSLHATNSQLWTGASAVPVPHPFFRPRYPVATCLECPAVVVAPAALADRPGPPSKPRGRGVRPGAMMLSPARSGRSARSSTRATSTARPTQRSTAPRSRCTRRASRSTRSPSSTSSRSEASSKRSAARSRVQELASLVPATANAAHYARIVRETSTLRGLIRVGSEIARLGWERPGGAGSRRPGRAGPVRALAVPRLR